MAKNLKTTKDNDGTAIPNISDLNAWPALAVCSLCDYNDVPSNSINYGKLYNWYVVDNKVATTVNEGVHIKRESDTKVYHGDIFLKTHPRQSTGPLSWCFSVLWDFLGSYLPL